MDYGPWLPLLQCVINAFSTFYIICRPCASAIPWLVLYNINGVTCVSSLCCIMQPHGQVTLVTDSFVMQIYDMEKLNIPVAKPVSVILA